MIKEPLITTNIGLKGQQRASLITPTRHINSSVTAVPGCKHWDAEMWETSNRLSPLCDYISWSNPRPFVLDYLSNKCFRSWRILMHSRSTKRHFDFRFSDCWEVQPEAPAHLTSKWMRYNQITWHFVDLACGVRSAPTAELKEEG